MMRLVCAGLVASGVCACESRPTLPESPVTLREWRVDAWQYPDHPETEIVEGSGMPQEPLR